MNIRLTGSMQLLSGMSHIGRVESNVAMLAAMAVVQDDGSVEDVPMLSGNAWRGMIRDHAASYLLDALKATVPADVFHLLFGGGRLSGESGTFDPGRIREMRRVVPMLSLLGGGLGNTLMPGKIKVGVWWPIIREAMPCLPESLREQAEAFEAASIMSEMEYSRRDDEKDANKATRTALPAQTDLLGDAEPAKKKAAKKEVAQQMRNTVWLMSAGTRLHHTVDFDDVTPVELGVWVSALHSWSRAPYVGGMANKGHGLCRVQYTWQDRDTGETGDFLTVRDDCLLSPKAAEAKDAYDQHLREQYDAFLAAEESPIKRILGAA